MKVLAAETSGRACSVCVADGEKLIFETYSDCGLTHGKQLVPTVEYVMKSCGLKPADIDLFAVSSGPGSFTGIRIGISAVKAMAWCADKPCAAVSSLEALAYNSGRARAKQNQIICCLTDARGGRMYNAMFECGDGKISRICEDRVILLDDLISDMKIQNKSYFLVGDGAKMCYTVSRYQINAEIAADNLLLPNAYGVALAGLRMHGDGKTVKSDALLPSYLVCSQAERERMEKDSAAGK